VLTAVPGNICIVLHFINFIDCFTYTEPLKFAILLTQHSCCGSWKSFLV